MTDIKQPPAPTNKPAPTEDTIDIEVTNLETPPVVKAGRRWPIWALPALIALLLIAAVAIYLLVNSSPSSPPTGDTNLTSYFPDETVEPEDANDILEAEVAEKKDQEPTFLAYALDQISLHNTAGDCWLVFENEIYDVSEWSYPGQTPIDEACGQRSARSHFEADNQPKPPPEYFIGIYTNPEVTD